MSLTMTMKKFEEMNLYSNKTLEKIARSLVNESSNAVLVNIYEDAVLLLDHKEGQFYLADYSFDHDKAVFKFENFEPIVLTKSEKEFRNDAISFFESEDVSTLSLVESYKNHIADQDGFISDLITESMIEKDFGDVYDYDKVAAVNEGTLDNEKFFAAYKARIATNPNTSIKRFDWKTPVSVSLVETEGKKIVNKAALLNAADLWKKDSFKDKFSKSASTFVEDVEAGTEMFKELFEEYPQVFRLDAADRKSLFGKAIIANNELRENKDDLLAGIKLLFEKYDLSDMKKQYLSEAEEEVPAEEGEEDVAPELTPEEISKIVDELHKVAKKVDDEKVSDKIDGLADKLDGGKEGDIAPADIKEAVEILSL